MAFVFVIVDSITVAVTSTKRISETCKVRNWPNKLANFEDPTRHKHGTIKRNSQLRKTCTKGFLAEKVVDKMIDRVINVILPVIYRLMFSMLHITFKRQ